jgi:serine protease Do
MIAEIRPGQIAHLQVWREKKSVPVDVRVGELHDTGETASANTAPGGSANANNIGLTVRTLTAAEKAQLKTRGNVVIVDATGPAADAGLQGGDVIVSINRMPITDITDFQRAIRGGHQDWTLLIVRQINGMPQQEIYTISLQ